MHKNYYLSLLHNQAVTYMQEKNLIHEWKETLSSRPSFRETFKDMHLSVLHQATQRKLNEGLLHIQFETHDFILCELKGRGKELTAFELPEKDEGILWLCIQLHGTLSFPTGKVSQPDTIFFFRSEGNENLLTIPVVKQWVLFIGITGASRQLLLTEQPSLRRQYDQQKTSMGTAVPVSFADRHVLETFSRTALGPFSTMHHIGLLLDKLYTSYTQQVDKRGEQSKDEGLIVIYHRAINYITEHYMDPDLNREKLASACNCSPRSMSRAFEGRPKSIKSNILLMRLHRSRELLHRHSDLTVEQIAAMLHFPSGQHFATQYKKCFNRTPREERKAMLTSK